MATQGTPEPNPAVVIVRRHGLIGDEQPKPALQPSWISRKLFAAVGGVVVVFGVAAFSFAGKGEPKVPLRSDVKSPAPPSSFAVSEHGVPASTEMRASGSHAAAHVDRRRVSSRNASAVGAINPDEFARLKTRNRRLEALVSVLRTRSEQEPPASSGHDADRTVVVVR